ncbi:MAG: hypothetical protein AAF657_25615 [Acidobacteriota bacterium]
MRRDHSLPRIRAVVQGEMRSLARVRAPFVLRTLYGALVAANVLLALRTAAFIGPSGMSSGQRLAFEAYNAFYSVAAGQAMLAAILGAIVGVVSANSERRNQTLGLLVLSQLRPFEVILGKLTALLGLVVQVLIAGVPVFAVIGWAGGLDYRWLGWLTILTLALAAQGICTGLALGFRWRSALGAVFAALLLMVVPILAASGSFGQIDSAPLRLVISFGLAVVGVASQGQDPEALTMVQTGLVVSLVWTVVMAVIASRALPRAAAAGEGRGLRGLFERLDRFFEAINVGGIRLGSGLQRGPRGNPVTWLEGLNAGLGLPQYGLRLLTAALLLACWSLVLVLDGGRWAGPVALFWGAGLVLVALSSGAATFGEEKARHCLGTLLATPMTARTILRGKLLTAAKLLAVTAIPIVLIAVVYESLYGFRSWDSQRLLAYALAGPLCGYLLARHMSLVLASTLRAGIAAAALLAALLLGFSLIGPFFDPFIWVLPLLTAFAIDRCTVLAFDRALGRSR